MEAALIVLDGWGLGSGRADGDHRDAVATAGTPNFDAYAEAGAYGTLETHGRRVGLPEGQMGNSEVGHLNIGAGRVVKQDSTRITDAVEDGSLYENDALVAAYDHAAGNDGRVHVLGLVSDGGVHSSQEHVHALLKVAERRGVPATTHVFTDGRDTAPQSGVEHVARLEEAIGTHGTGEVSTVTGRYYAMDRDENWDRTRSAYDAIVDREAPHEAASAVEAIEASYERGDTDEFVEPTLVEGGHALSDGDSVVFANFRSDRARQLTRMLAGIRPEWEFDTSPPDVHLVTMTEYDATFGVPAAFGPNRPEDTFGEVVSETGRTQLRLAETEKYAHVTYFLNGGREVEFEGERREIVPSPDVPTYDERPEMSAFEVTETAVEVIGSDDPDVMVLNYANPDMVGHTGDFEATVAAVEAVDECLGKLVPVLREHGAGVLLTADHGNADDLGSPENPHTAHTLNPVPLVYLAPDESGEIDSGGTGDGDLSGGYTAREGGTLADVAPTLLKLMGVEQPEAMTGETLLE
jgi:2,3-bisphosphoglycerate-independent phosphoglycerate mutase